MSSNNNTNRYTSTSTLPPPPPYDSTAPTFVNNHHHQTTPMGNDERNDISTMYYYSSIDMIRAAHYDPKNPFAFTAEQLSTLIEKRDLKFLNDIGGILGMAKGLHSDIMQGIAENERYPLRSITLNDLVSAASTCNKSTTSDDDDDSDENDDDILDEDMLAYCTAEEYEKYYNGKKNVDDGDVGDEIEMHRQRKSVFGKNILPCIQHKSLCRLIWLALQDKTLVNK